MLHQPDGRPIPIDADLEAFAAFGGEVHAYMSFVRRACAAFLACFLLALPQLYTNLRGGDVGARLLRYW